MEESQNPLLSSSSLRTPLVEITGDGTNSVDYYKLNDKKKILLQEVNRQLWLAGPLISVSLLQFSLQLISLMFVGHLGELSLSGASIATSFSTATGFNLLAGMASALDTLCGQSYGAKQYHMVGILMQSAIIILSIVSIPIAVIWANTGSILLLLGQDPDISREAGIYACFMIPSIFAYALLQPLTKFLQTQNIVFPMMITAAITVLFHLPMCWILVFKTSLGVRGAALAISLSNWINVLLLALHVKFSSSCAKTWNGFSKDALQNIPDFIKLAIPSAVMVCLEMWSFEMMVLLYGLLPNPKLETSVLSICLNTAGTVWMIPFGLSNAVSTRVSNELGAGHPEAARLAVQVVLGMAVAEGILIGSILIVIRNIWGLAYSNEIEVVRYVARMMPILAMSNFMDGLQCVLSGTIRGCEFQKIGAFVNLGSYYLVGFRCAVLFAFVLHIRGEGLWFGILCALLVQVLCLLAIVFRIKWDQEARKAKEESMTHYNITVSIMIDPMCSMKGFPKT